MNTDSEIYTRYQKLRGALNELGDYGRLMPEVTLHTLHFTWDDSLRANALLEPVEEVFLKTASSDELNSLLDLYKKYTSAVVNWLTLVHNSEDEAVDEMINKLFTFMVGQEGDGLYEHLQSQITARLTVFLEQARCDLPAPPAFELSSEAKKLISRSRLEAGLSMFECLCNTLKQLHGGEDRQEYTEQLFFEYVVTCRFLDEFRRDSFVYRRQKIGPNEACPCGRGRKYKFCHGK